MNYNKQLPISQCVPLTRVSCTSNSKLELLHVAQESITTDYQDEFVYINEFDCYDSCNKWRSLPECSFNQFKIIDAMPKQTCDLNYNKQEEQEKQQFYIF